MIVKKITNSKKKLNLLMVNINKKFRCSSFKELEMRYVNRII